MSTRTPPALILVLAAALASRASGGGEFTGKAFPDFTATDAVTGERFSLSDMRGRVVLLDFWATWCGPCIRELPNVKRVYNKYKGQGLELVGVSLDSNTRQFKAGVERHGMQWRHVMEGGGWRTRLARKYRIQSIPRMFVIGPDGRCLGESNRVHNLESAIERGLQQVAGDRTPDHAISPVLTQLQTAQTDLDRSSAPLRAVEQRLDRLRRQVDGMRLQLRAVAQRPEALERSYAYVLDELVAARRILFGLGAYGIVVVMPGDPYAGLEKDDPTLFTRMAEELEIASRAVDTLAGARQELQRQVDDLSDRIVELHRDLDTGRGDPETLSGEVARLTAAAAAEVARFEEPWERRIAALQAVLAGCSKPIAALGPRLDGIEKELASSHRRLEAELDGLRANLDAGDRVSPSAAFRKRLDEVSDEVLALQDRAASLNPA